MIGEAAKFKATPPSRRGYQGKGKKQEEYARKLRRRVEDRLRKDREALLLVARVLNIT